MVPEREVDFLVPRFLWNLELGRTFPINLPPDISLVGPKQRFRSPVALPFHETGDGVLAAGVRCWCAACGYNRQGLRCYHAVFL